MYHMLYASCIVDSKTQGKDRFIYAVLPHHLAALAPGVLVEVPWRNRTVLAVVAGILRRPSVPSKIKPIKSLVAKTAVVTSGQFALADWLADYYGVSLGQALFAIVPEFSRTYLAKQL